MNDFAAEDTYVEVTEGDQALLECRAPDSYPDKNIYWSSYKTTGRSENIVNIDSLAHFATSRNGDLYFSYTKQSDTGVYYCRVENEKLRRFESRMVKLKVLPSKCWLRFCFYIFLLPQIHWISSRSRDGKAPRWKYFAWTILSSRFHKFYATDVLFLSVSLLSRSGQPVFLCSLRICGGSNEIYLFVLFKKHSNEMSVQKFGLSTITLQWKIRISSWNVFHTEGRWHAWCLQSPAIWQNSTSEKHFSRINNICSSVNS